LEDIVRQTGPDDTRHFDKLLERLGLRWNPEVIAAGVVAYRATYPVYLRPFADAVPTLLRLRDMGLKLGVASKGRAVKQWQKLTQLGLEHMFHAVTVSEQTGSELLNSDTLSKTLERLGVKPENSFFVGNDLSREIAIANDTRMITIRMRTGANRSAAPKNANETPAYEIDRLSGIPEILRTRA
jgi:putative hydrolase of the HAD superfamily